MARLGGRVQRQVRRAFWEEPELSTTELLGWVYPAWALLGERRTKNIWRTRQEARRYADIVGRRNPGGFIWRVRERD
jgi:hypothetical protein